MPLAIFSSWFAFSILFILGNKQNGKLFKPLIAIVLALVAFLHGIDNNPDRQNYLNYVSLLEDNRQPPIEPIYYLIVYILKAAFQGDSLQAAFILIVAYVSVLIKLSLFKRYGGALAGCLAMYLSYYFMVFDIVQIRIGLAVSFLYLSWFSLLEGKVKSFYAFGFLAVISHLSCLVFVLGPWIKNYRLRSGHFLTLSNLSLIVLTIFSLLYPSGIISAISFLADMLDVDKLVQYVIGFEEGGFTTINYVRIFPYLMLLFFFLGCSRDRWMGDRFVVFQIKTLALGIVAFLIFSPIPAFAYRISDIFLFSSIFLLGNAYKFMTRPTYLVFIALYTLPIIYYSTMMSGLFAQ